MAAPETKGLYSTSLLNCDPAQVFTRIPAIRNEVLDIAMTDDLGLAAGFRDGVYYLDDNDAWQQILTGVGDVQSVAIANETGYAGAEANIYESATSGATWVDRSKSGAVYKRNRADARGTITTSTGPVQRITDGLLFGPSEDRSTERDRAAVDDQADVMPAVRGGQRRLEGHVIVRRRAADGRDHRREDLVGIVLTHGHEDLSNRFAWKQDEDRFAEGRWTTAATGAPVLEDALCWLDCTIHSKMKAGTHTIYVGEVQACHEPMPDQRPLVYWDRDYRQIRHRS